MAQMRFTGAQTAQTPTPLYSVNTLHFPCPPAILSPNPSDTARLFPRATPRRMQAAPRSVCVALSGAWRGRVQKKWRRRACAARDVCLITRCRQDRVTGDTMSVTRTRCDVTVHGCPSPSHDTGSFVIACAPQKIFRWQPAGPCKCVYAFMRLCVCA